MLGEKNKNSKYDIFSKEQRIEAVEMYKTGIFTHQQIADKYGVSRRLIGTIVFNIKIKKNKNNIFVYENEILINEIKMGL